MPRSTKVLLEEEKVAEGFMREEEREREKKEEGLIGLSVLLIGHIFNPLNTHIRPNYN